VGTLEKNLITHDQLKDKIASLEKELAGLKKK